MVQRRNQFVDKFVQMGLKRLVHVVDAILGPRVERVYTLSNLHLQALVI